jgi:hypothetical protein
MLCLEFSGPLATLALLALPLFQCPRLYSAFCNSINEMKLFTTITELTVDVSGRSL